MTRTISLVGSLALAGLALVPAAWGNHQYGDAFVGTRSPDFWNYDPQTGAKIADASPGVAPEDLAALTFGVPATFAPPPDVVDRAVAARQALEPQSTPATFPDVVERAVAARADQAGARRDVGDNYRDVPKPTSLPASITGSDSSGRDIEWLQIGIGIAAGILLSFGLVLGLRVARIRPLAH